MKILKSRFKDSGKIHDLAIFQQKKIKKKQYFLLKTKTRKNKLLNFEF